MLENMRAQITFTEYDVIDFLGKFRKNELPKRNTFLYLDHPYYQRGKELYLNF
jgi:hypothetical protein